MADRQAIINRIGILYKDLLSKSLKSLSDQDKEAVLKLIPKNKVIAIGDVDSSNWNAYPLTYLLENKITSPTVLDESKIYQSIQAMRNHNESIVHPQNLIGQSVVIHMIGMDSSPGINDYVNTFLNMCIASDQCKVIFIVFEGDKRFYKNNMYIKKTNSTFIDTATGQPFKIESVPLAISPDDIAYFNHSKKNKPGKTLPRAISVEVTSTISSRRANSCSALLDDPDLI